MIKEEDNDKNIDSLNNIIPWNSKEFPVTINSIRYNQDNLGIPVRYDIETNEPWMTQKEISNLFNKNDIANPPCPLYSFINSILNNKVLKNIKKINMDNEIFKAVCDINQITNIKDKLSNIIDLYNKINSDKINNKPLPNSTFLRKKDDLKIYIFPSLKFIIKNSLSSINDISECMQISKQINRKILLLLGEVGVGKTTLLNSFINALYEIQFEDNFRYILSDELNNNNGTEYINIYNIDSFKNNPPITIIDTPGFGKGIEFDENINEMIKKLINNYIEHINAICLIFNGSNLKLSSNQQKIINNILKFFGNDL